MRSKKYYAYTIPDLLKSGIVENWNECERIVSGKENARYKSFSTKEEAELWLRMGADYRYKKQMPEGIYFDAGTGRGNGVEIRVTDEQGNNLLKTVLPKKSITKFGTLHLKNKETNNYGELLACKYALEIALRDNKRAVYGDSRLVIEYWSRGFVKKNEVLNDTMKLAGQVADLKKRFELCGGTLNRISGDDNPADLGFH